MNVDFFEKMHERLKNERKRMYLTQTEIAEQCEVSATTYSNYETGKRKPDAKFLQSFSELGGDISYLFTGRKTVGALNHNQSLILELFHSLTTEQQVEAFGYLYSLSANRAAKNTKKSTASVTQTVSNSKVENIAGGNIQQGARFYFEDDE